MKSKSKSTQLPTKDLIKKKDESEIHQKGWRKTGLRVAAVCLIIVFLASECAALLPVG
jgi:hypothetical protein